MSVQMAKPLIPFPLPPEKEKAILDDIHLSDKPLYIRSKESEVHVGTKIVFEIRNEEDIEKLHPLIKSLGQSSSDSSSKNFITEVKKKQSLCDKPSVVMDNNDSEQKCIIDSQKPQNIAGICDSGRSEGVLMADSNTCNTPENQTIAISSHQEDSFLLTPEHFQNNKLLESIKGDDISSRHTSGKEKITQYNASINFSQSLSENIPLKLVMPQQPVQHSEYYTHLPPMPYQQTDITTSQSHHSLSCHHEQINCNADMIESTCFPHLLSQSVPLGFSSSPPQVVENLPRVRVHDELPVKRAKDEHPNDYRIQLNKNYMEERKFKLYVIPGIFYDTPHGILVEMKNGSNYEIGLANDNSEDCNVDLYVDMELVYRIRLNAYGRTILDGPQNRTKKFLFLRAFDAPPEANIINRHERNGQIKAVFTPSDEKRRAWSTDSAASCSRFLNQAIGNIMGPSIQGTVASPPPAPEREYRSASFCSGATALQGEQREKFYEFAEYMRVDENRMVVLQLRLIASVDDKSRPSTAEPIVPLITKMPPPLPF